MKAGTVHYGSLLIRIRQAVHQSKLKTFEYKQQQRHIKWDKEARTMRMLQAARHLIGKCVCLSNSGRVCECRALHRDKDEPRHG